MRGLRRNSPPQGAPRDVAIHWLAREDEGRLAADDRAALEAWLEADPAHRQAYETARAMVAVPRRHAADPQMMELRVSALAALRERPPRLWRIAAGVAAALVLGGGWTVLRPDTGASVSRFEETARSVAPALHPNTAVYRTAVGERSSVTLPDGSIATLNTDTLLKVAYTRGERGVRLVRGQALFEVAKHKPAPFQVYAGDRVVTAVGTVFDVRLDRGKVKVALVEGVVRVARAPMGAASAPVQQVMMNAGEALEASPAAPMTIRAIDAASATTWTDGVVVFKAASLADAVAEVNRYTREPLTIADPSVAGYRFTGVFKTGDPGQFARSVAEVLPVEVETSPDGSLVLRGRPEKSSAPG